jgi:hypothetical protein
VGAIAGERGCEVVAQDGAELVDLGRVGQRSPGLASSPVQGC